MRPLIRQARFTHSGDPRVLEDIGQLPGRMRRRQRDHYAACLPYRQRSGQIFGTWGLHAMGLAITNKDSLKDAQSNATLTA